MVKPSIARRLAGTDHEQRVALLELAGLWDDGPKVREPFRQTHRGQVVVITRDDWRELQKTQERIDAMNHAMASSGRFMPLRGGVSEVGRVQRAANLQRSGANTTEGAGGEGNAAAPPSSIPPSS